MAQEFLTSNWPVKKIKAVTTLQPSGFNLAWDEPTQKQQLIELQSRWQLPHLPLLLRQEHSDNVVDVGATSEPGIVADASITTVKGLALGILTADCLPVVLYAPSVGIIAAVHAGWRGIALEIINKTINKLAVSAAELLVWLGPAIAPQDYQIDTKVYAAFAKVFAAKELAKIMQPCGAGHWYANLVIAATLQCQALGVKLANIYKTETSTYQDLTCYSHRRGDLGRMATFIWMS